MSHELPIVPIPPRLNKHARRHSPATPTSIAATARLRSAAKENGSREPPCAATPAPRLHSPLPAVEAKHPLERTEARRPGSIADTRQRPSRTRTYAGQRVHSEDTSRRRRRRECGDRAVAVSRGCPDQAYRSPRPIQEYQRRIETYARWRTGSRSCRNRRLRDARHGRIGEVIGGPQMPNECIGTDDGRHRQPCTRGCSCNVARAARSPTLLLSLPARPKRQSDRPRSCPATRPKIRETGSDAVGSAPPGTARNDHHRTAQSLVPLVKSCLGAVSAGDRLATYLFGAGGTVASGRWGLDLAAGRLARSCPPSGPTRTRSVLSRCGIGGEGVARSTLPSPGFTVTAELVRPRGWPPRPAGAGHLVRARGWKGWGGCLQRGRWATIW